MTPDCTCLIILTLKIQSMKNCRTTISTFGGSFEFLMRRLTFRQYDCISYKNSNLGKNGGHLANLHLKKYCRKSAEKTPSTQLQVPTYLLEITKMHLKFLYAKNQLTQIVDSIIIFFFFNFWSPIVLFHSLRNA